MLDGIRHPSGRVRQFILSAGWRLEKEAAYPARLSCSSWQRCPSTVKCNAALRAVLDAGNAAQQRPGEPVFAFRLHQFLSSGGSVYTTLEPPDMRTFSSEGPFYAPREAGKA